MSLEALIQKHLSDDLLKPFVLRRKQPDDHPTFGHCYVACEVLKFILDLNRHSSTPPWRPHVVRMNGFTHWFLVQSSDEWEGSPAIRDPTEGQFLARGVKRIPYELGHPCGFLTGDRPSKRARILLGRLYNAGMVNIPKDVCLFPEADNGSTTARAESTR